MNWNLVIFNKMDTMKKIYYIILGLLVGLVACQENDKTDFDSNGAVYFQLSSRARKWGAILTSITQHVRSVLDNEDARRMLSDCGYIKLLNQSPDDANDLARLLHISNEEKRYIENAEVGSGLLIVSKTVVPFSNDFPKDTELFRLMDTSPNRKS